MKVRQMTNDKGRAIANQFIITDEGRGANGNFIKKETFQSYDSIIAVKTVWNDRTDITLDNNAWDYSVTTGKYRNLFLGENITETRKKIKSGKYTLTDLN